ncbi:MAG: type IV pili methyl-accepting chemotaxis transducer N-terminal domain-containing protein [Pseudomonadota bacterium]
MPTPSTFRLTTAATSLACALLLTGPALAEQDLAFDGSKVRVNLSNKLNMLGQQISAASCAMKAGINPYVSMTALDRAKTDFDTIMAGLKSGDPALGIPTGEQRSNVLKALASVDKAWAPIRAAAEQMIAQENIAPAAQVIADGNMELLERTGILAFDVLNTYANPHEMTQSDALALNFSGRQRMLTYQIAKTACGIKTDVAAFGTQEDLSKHMQMYELSLTALREGMDAVGINPPPNDLVAGELSNVADDWAVAKPALATIVQSGSAEPADLIAFNGKVDGLVKDMNNVVTLYMLAAPESEQVYKLPLQAYARDELSKWLTDPQLIEAVKAQNLRHASLSQADVDQLDLDWRAQAKNGGGPLIDKLLSGPASEALLGRQNATAGFVTEVFAMDNKGLNVAQSVETSDYWQGDEAKWKQTFGDGSGATHISEVEYDDSTGAYQTQVSLPLRDPTTGELIGAITFGINVQSLL